MENAQDLAKRFREVILHGTWIANTNFKDQLQGSHWEVAAAKVGTLNSIAAIAQHIHYYIAGINNVLQGGSLDISDRFSFDFPDITSQEAWDAFLTKFWNDSETLAVLVDQMSSNQLSEVFTDEKYGTYQRNIEAMIEHSYYHLGQIVLLSKIVTEGK